LRKAFKSIKGEKIMAAIEKIRPRYFGSTIENGRDIEKTISLEAVKDPETTMATVMMTQLHDTRLETQFNRLLLMGQNDKVTRTYTLNRKITHIGRSRSNPVRIKDPLVSVKHLTVSVSNDSCVVNDHDSSNGTFINGERLVGGRTLKDGDEIMLGKTILRFAARQGGAPEQSAKRKKRPVAALYKKRSFIPVAAMVCMVLTAGIMFMAAHGAPDRIETKEAPQPVSRQAPPRRAVGEPAAASATAAQVDKSTGAAPQRTRPVRISNIQRALADYAAGRLDRAIQTLDWIAITAEITPEAGQAANILSMVKMVRQLHTQALQAQKQKKFARALECWDRLLAVDMELVGERPSFFARQAEQRVQALSYEHALRAYQLKNYKKVKQLCQVILQIDPKHPQALTLLAKIEPKA
jgi:hypothetical protein